MKYWKRWRHCKYISHHSRTYKLYSLKPFVSTASADYSNTFHSTTNSASLFYISIYHHLVIHMQNLLKPSVIKEHVILAPAHPHSPLIAYTWLPLEHRNSQGRRWRKWCSRWRWGCRQPSCTSRYPVSSPGKACPPPSRCPAPIWLCWIPTQRQEVTLYLINFHHWHLAYLRNDRRK